MHSFRQLPILLAFVVGFLCLGAHTADAGTITMPAPPPERELYFPEDPDDAPDDSVNDTDRSQVNDADDLADGLADDANGTDGLVNEPPPGPAPTPVEPLPPGVILGDVKSPPKK